LPDSARAFDNRVRGDWRCILGLNIAAGDAGEKCRCAAHNPAPREVAAGHDGAVSIAAAHAEAFYGESLNGRGVWGVRDAGGCPAPMTPDGHRAMPFWSTRSRAEKIAKNVPAFAGMEPFEITLDEWRTKWLPDLAKHGIRVGLNWSGKRAVGYDLPVADLLRNLTAHEDRGIR